MIVGDFLDSVYDLGDKWIGDSGDDDTDCFCPSGDQASSDGAGSIALLASNLSNSLRGLGG